MCTYNKSVKLEAKTVFNETLYFVAKWVINGLCDEFRIIPFDTLLKRVTVALDRMTWNGIVNCVCKELEGNAEVGGIDQDMFTLYCGIRINSCVVNVDIK